MSTTSTKGSSVGSCSIVEAGRIASQRLAFLIIILVVVWPPGVDCCLTRCLCRCCRLLSASFTLRLYSPWQYDPRVLQIPYRLYTSYIIMAYGSAIRGEKYCAWSDISVACTRCRNKSITAMSPTLVRFVRANTSIHPPCCAVLRPPTQHNHQCRRPSQTTKCPPPSLPNTTINFWPAR